MLRVMLWPCLGLLACEGGEIMWVRLLGEMGLEFPWERSPKGGLWVFQ